MPSCPRLSLPQQYARPSSAMPQLAAAPLEMATKARVVATSMGVALPTWLPSPMLPDRLDSQQNARLFSEIPHVLFVPTLTD